jgi:putative flippase GtrA
MSKWLSLTKELITFGIVGLIQIALDWLVFVVLSQHGISLTIANTAGRISGAAIGYWLNGRWTFSKNFTPSLGPRQLFRFAISWILTTAISTVIVVIADHSRGLHWSWIIKPIADAGLALVGFLASKLWIYKHPPAFNS